MPFFELFKGYPFPGAFAKFALPPGPNDWQPKTWGTTGYSIGLLTDLRDFFGHFIDDGVQPGDVIYITAADPPLQLATFVFEVVTNTYLITTYQFLDIHINMVYKIGMKAPHNLQSLATIIGARGLYATTIHWSLVWTQAPFLDFRYDELGDVYVCHNPGPERKYDLMQDQYFDEDGNPGEGPHSENNDEDQP